MDGFEFCLLNGKVFMNGQWNIMIRGEQVFPNMDVIRLQIYSLNRRCEICYPTITFARLDKKSPEMVSRSDQSF